MATIESADVKILLAAVGGLLTLIFGFTVSIFKLTKRALTPNGGQPATASVHDKLTQLQRTVDDRFGSHERELADHDRRITWLEDLRKGA